MKRALKTRFAAALAAALAIALCAPVLAAEARFVVIVNPANGVGALTKAQVADFFLKKTTRWADGREVKPVDLETTSETRAKFSDAVLGKDVGAVSSYWQRAIFAGRGVPPVEKASDKEVIAFVQANPGAVGYVSAGAPLEGVKAIEVR